MRQRVVLDLSGLSMHGTGAASATWWGTLSFMLLEGTGFALTIAIYLYLFSLAPHWPIDARPPDLGPGTLVTILLLFSIVPNMLVSRWAEEGDVRKMRIGMVIMSLLGLGPLILRAFEFAALNVKWDDNAYGSIVWTMLGLHTTHIITDAGDTIVLAVMMFTRHGDNKRRHGDVQDNAMYWNFVVATWLPIYGCLYWIPRL